jgi:hypothetical protein
LGKSFVNFIHHAQYLEMKIIIRYLEIYVYIQDRAAEREGGGRANCPGPTLIGPQLESESLKLSRFFKLVR